MTSARGVKVAVDAVAPVAANHEAMAALKVVRKETVVDAVLVPKVKKKAAPAGVVAVAEVDAVSAQHKGRANVSTPMANLRRLTLPRPLSMRPDKTPPERSPGKTVQPAAQNVAGAVSAARIAIAAPTTATAANLRLGN